MGFISFHKSCLALLPRMILAATSPLSSIESSNSIILSETSLPEDKRQGARAVVVMVVGVVIPCQT